MSEKTRVATWDLDVMHQDYQPELRLARVAWLREYFTGHHGGPYEVPRFPWLAEFDRVTSRHADDYFTMTLHEYAVNAGGHRYLTWVRGFDAEGNAVSVQLQAVNRPCELHLDELPPGDLL